MIAAPIAVRTAGGHTARFAVRDDTNDAALAYGIIEGREYPPMVGLTGWAIDVGAHIGIVTVALALDNPGLRIVAVEALAENVAMLRENVALNGLGDRVHVEAAAASSEAEWQAGATVPVVYGWSHAEGQPDGFMQESKYIGGMVGPNDSTRVADCPALSLAGIRARYHIATVALVKIDCEGCEWYFLRSPDIHAVDRIVGELHHGKNGGAREFRAILAPTHAVTMDDAKNVAIFDAVRLRRTTNAWVG